MVKFDSGRRARELLLLVPEGHEARANSKTVLKLEDSLRVRQDVRERPQLAEETIVEEKGTMMVHRHVFRLERVAPMEDDEAASETKHVQERIDIVSSNAASVRDRTTVRGRAKVEQLPLPIVDLIGAHVPFMRGSMHSVDRSQRQKECPEIGRHHPSIVATVESEHDPETDLLLR